MPAVDLKFNRGMDALIRKLRDAAKDVPELAQRAIIAAAIRAKDVAQSRTPVSRPRQGPRTQSEYSEGFEPGGGRHLADQWKVQVGGLDGDLTRGNQAPRYQTRIYNSDPRANTPIVLATGETTNYTLLHLLEYGTDPHLIFPVFSSHLKFYWPRKGRFTAMKFVNHPGITRPYGMLAVARVEARAVLRTWLELIKFRVKRGL